MEWIEGSGMLGFVDQPKRGMGGPTLLLPVLAKYVQTKEARWGRACIDMLKDYHRAFAGLVMESGHEQDKSSMN